MDNSSENQNAIEKYVLDGIYENGSYYYDFNIAIPENTPDFIRKILIDMEIALCEGRNFDFMRMEDDLDTSVKHAHMFNAISTEDANVLFSKLGWKFYGTEGNF